MTVKYTACVVPAFNAFNSRGGNKGPSTLTTRMHSSRMLTVRCSDHQGGVCRGGVSAWGVSAQGGLPGGCLAGGVSAQGGMCIPACTEADTPHGQNDRQM